jgi:pimeloyl-ACP methyl ester carboxylesterase
MDIQPYNINVKQSVLDDLRVRLTAVRWPDQPEGAGWSLGTNLEITQALVEYWRDEYDWRKVETSLNSFQHFLATGSGEPLHFIHEKCGDGTATPLLLVHGWPDSFFRYHKVIKPLAERFNVVVVSLPGMGFSGHEALAVDDMADKLLALMHTLGYERFIVAGGDIGSIISMSLAQSHSDAVLGYHVTDVGYPDHTTDFAVLSQSEQEYAGAIQQWFMRHGAFNILQSSKPQSLAFAMTDSPVGFAAWVLSFMGGMGLGDDVLRRFGKEDLITNIMIYWVSDTIASSFRSYAANAMQPATLKGDARVPVAVATEVPIPGGVRVPREWADRQTGGNVVQFHDMPHAGHFAAWEDPEYYVKDIESFAKLIAS